MANIALPEDRFVRSAHGRAEVNVKNIQWAGATAPGLLSFPGLLSEPGCIDRKHPTGFAVSDAGTIFRHAAACSAMPSIHDSQGMVRLKACYLAFITNS
jgi:hypothetical protein